MDNSTAQDNGKTVAIISYITLIGWIVALIMHNSNKTRLGAFHLRQMLGLIILVAMVYILGYVLNFIPMGWLIGTALNIGILIFWIMGLIAAASGEEKPMPIIGDMFQKWFAGFAT